MSTSQDLRSHLPSRKRARKGDEEHERLAIFVLDIEEVNGGDIFIYGCTRDRASVVLKVTGFEYSFFLEVPDLITAEESVLSQEVLGDIRRRVSGIDFRTETVKRRSLVCYRRQPDIYVLQVYQSVPMGSRKLVKAFETVLGDDEIRPYETQVDLITRFSLDSGIRCGSWISWEVDEDLHPKSSSSSSRLSTCDREYEGSWDEGRRLVRVHQRPLTVHAYTETEWSDIPPLRVLSFGVQRSPTSLPVDQWPEDGQCPYPISAISVILTNGGGHLHSKTKIILLNTEGLSHLEAEAQRHSNTYGPWVTRLYRNEKEVLQAFQDLVLQEDPSLLTGFQVGEGLRVLLSRADALKLRTFGTISRRKGAGKVNVKTMQMYSAKWAKTKTRMSTTTNQEGTEVSCPGRVVVDIMRVLHSNDSLRLYSLTDISLHVLSKTFEILSAEQVSSLLRGNDRIGWSRAMQQVFAPADLALEVMAKKNTAIEMIELSRVIGMPLQNVYIRGQMARVSSLLLIHATQKGIIIPASSEELNKTPLQKSALVLDPMPQSPQNPEGIGTVGLRRSPVAILDFTSLYPSIIIEHNLCYSSLVKRSNEVDEDTNIYITPIGAKFVQNNVRPGVLPELLKDLLTARRHAQREIRESSDEALKRVMDARQKAFKLCSNSMYGFTGANVNSLFARELGDSILALGREYLLKMIGLVEAEYPALKVVYGDTDSVFIEYPEWSIEEAMEHAKSVLAPAINAQLPTHIKIKMEKILCPFLLQHIRRYAGYEVQDSTDLSKTRLEIKGMEAVTRNNMPFLVTCMQQTLVTLFETNDLDAVKEVVRKFVNHLMTDKLDLSQLTWTKGLWRLGEYDAKVPHVWLIERLEREDPRRVFRVGERVPYVLTQKGSEPLYKKTELPVIALMNHMSLDLEEYLKQMRMPMVRLLSLVMPTAEAEELFKPSFRAIQTGKISSSPSSIGKYFQRSTLQCIGCRSMLPSTGGGGASAAAAAGAKPLCETCRTSPWRPLLPLRETKDLADVEYQRAYRHCSHCQRGSMQLEVICYNETCPVMYRREKYKHVGEETQKKIDEIESHLA